MPASKLSRFKDEFAKMLFGRELRDSIKKEVCVCCGGPAVTFRDRLSQQEYGISGLCQLCQDKTFER